MALVTASACSNDSSTSPSSTTTSALATTTEMFSGTLSPKGTAFFSFVVSTAGPVSVTLASTTTAKVGPAVPVRLSVGVGVPSATTCATTAMTEVTPGLTTQLLNMTGTGTYCVNLVDPGTLSGDILFVVRIQHS
jgi:hypothetical protein